MAIKNASDLLVYRRYPTAVKQKTRIFIKSSSPTNATGTINILNSATENGVNVASIETASATTGDQFLEKIRAKLILDSKYNAPTSSTTDGDYVFRDFENEFAGELSNDITLGNGTATIDSDAVIISVIREGETATKDPIAHSTSASFSVSQDYRDITTKDSGGFQQNAAGLRSFEITTEALQDYNSDLDFRDFFNSVGSRESVTVRFAERDTGGSSDKYYEGTAFITSLSMNAGVEDNATYSVTFTGTATITSGTD